MFIEAVVFLSAIIGVLLALSAFVFHLITRSKSPLGAQEVEEALDAVTDLALEEINRTSKLVMDELEEKYKALLFVYQLIDDKQKELEAGKEESALERAADILTNQLNELDISIGDDLEVNPVSVEDVEVSEKDMDVSEEDIDETLGLADFIGLDEAVVPADTKVNESSLPRIAAHPKFEAIKELQDIGLGIAEIARRLDMGQGEVQLILGLSGR